MGLFDKLNTKMEQKKAENLDKLVTPYLFEGEQILHTVSVISHLIATDRRILHFDFAGGTGVKYEVTSIPYDRIDHISVEHGVTTDKIKVHTLQKEFAIGMIPRGGSISKSDTESPSVQHWIKLNEILSQQK